MFWRKIYFDIDTLYHSTTSCCFTLLALYYLYHEFCLRPALDLRVSKECNPDMLLLHKPKHFPWQFMSFLWTIVIVIPQLQLPFVTPGKTSKTSTVLKAPEKKCSYPLDLTRAHHITKQKGIHLKGNISYPPFKKLPSKLKVSYLKGSVHPISLVEVMNLTWKAVTSSPKLCRSWRSRESSCGNRRNGEDEIRIRGPLKFKSSPWKMAVGRRAFPIGAR